MNKELLTKEKFELEEQISKLEKENKALELEAKEIEKIQSSLTFEPYKALDAFVWVAVRDYAFREDRVSCEKHLKNQKVLSSMKDLIQEYRALPETNRAKIQSNSGRIKETLSRILEIESELDQLELPLCEAR